MNDHIGTAHMTQGDLTTFTLDRFGNQNSALALNGGWTQVPAGIYFDTPEFTISVWVYPQQVGSWARVIDFGNGQGINSIYLSLSDGSDCMPVAVVTDPLFYVVSSQRCTLNQWQLLTATFDGRAMKIYINTTLTATYNLSSNVVIPSLNRTKNYVGKSNLNGDGYSFSYIDELRFYNKSLTQSQINELMLLYDENNRTDFKSSTTKITPITTTTISLGKTKDS
jgi:hypothetical protein